MGSYTGMENMELLKLSRIIACSKFKILHHYLPRVQFTKPTTTYIVLNIGGGAGQRVRRPIWVVGIVKVQGESLAFYLGVAQGKFLILEQ